MASSSALDLVNQVLRKVQWPTVTSLTGDTVAPEVPKVLDLLNLVAQEVAAFYAYPFLRRTGIIIPLAKFNTGTVTATRGSNAVNQTGTASPNHLYIGGILKISSVQEHYRITNIKQPAGTQITIEPYYLGTTISTGVSYEITKDTYPLPEDFDRPFNANQFVSYPPGLTPTSPPEIQGMLATHYSTGNPTHYTTIFGDDGKWYIVFYPVPDTAQQIRIDYVRQINQIARDQDSFIFPLRMEPVLIDATAYLLKRDQQNDLQAAQVVIQDYLRKRAESTRPTSTSNRMTMTPSTERRQHEVLKITRWGKYDFGDLWDRWLPWR